MQIVRANRDKFGLNRMLSVLDLPSSTWYYREKEKEKFEDKYNHLKPVIEEVIRAHPEYGRPRITRQLQEVHGIDVNHKVVGRLLRKWDLALLRAARETSPSPVEKALEKAGSDANLVKKRLQSESAVGLFEIMYTDFTDIKYAGGDRTAKLMPMIDHTSKLILGWAMGTNRNRAVACRALEQTKKTLEDFDFELRDKIIHQDQDSVYTSDKWVDLLLIENRGKLSYSTNGAKGNPYMESFNGHFKLPIQSLLTEAERMSEVREVIRERVRDWNYDRRHSSLGQIAPMRYIKQELDD